MKLSGLKIYTKLTLNSYAQMAAESFRSNLIIGVSAEVLQDLLENPLYQQAFDEQESDTFSAGSLIKVKAFDIPK